ncbi:MAG TPA: radical SAM family heme chaperone HemW [Gemmatimonadota bacterium]|nr:radical SAM family heme chaperone HemW [Gemmatimonadota bacterium]
MTTETAAPLHLYVHVPFCARKCPYCHFYNLGHDDAREAVFLDAIEREMAGWRARGAFDGGRLETLYWGGGTPSMLTAAGFERLAGLCLAVAPAAADLEWTLEVNPDDAGAERFGRWRAWGVDRVSIGAQSFDPGRLAFLGRTHGPRRAIDAVRGAAEAGFRSVSIDLMFNLAAADPVARRRAWARDLATALALPIHHLSLYGLTIEPGTAFAARTGAGATLTVPDPAYAAEYRAARRAAERAGFEHYEISSFARPGHRSRHNSAYWSGARYLGLGPSAHSFDGRRRWANSASLTEWAEALAVGGDPREFVETLGPDERAIETLYLGLRTREGAPAGHPLLAAPAARSVVDALREEGLLRRVGGRIACTEAGYLVLDALLERLVGPPGPPTGRIDKVLQAR